MVFCMFAEDVDLLPGKLFKRMLAGRAGPAGDLADNAQTLFAAMARAGRQGRLRAHRVVQRRHLRRRQRAAAERNGHRVALSAANRNWSEHRPVDHGHPVRARPRPRQAQPARRPLHRPRQDHADRQPGDRRAADARVGGEARRDRGQDRAIAQGQVPRSAHARLQRGDSPQDGVPGAAEELPRARPGLRLRQLPLSGAQGAEEHRAPRQRRVRGTWACRGASLSSARSA